jgi:methanethiol oxidase
MGMTSFFPDPTFYPSPKIAMQSPKEMFAYVAILQEMGSDKPDAIVKVDVNSGKVVDRVDMEHVGDELHHYGWNACSSSLCPYAPHPHVNRRYLIVPGIRSSRLYVIDTKPKLKIIKTIEPDAIHKKTGYSRLHTIHCGAQGIYVSALGNPEGNGPGGLFLLDHDTFEILEPFEKDRGSQYLSYDFGWHLNQEIIITSEWGTPRMVEGGIIPEKLLNHEYGHRLHFFSMQERKNIQTIDLGKEHQMVLELRPAHDPQKNYGFASVVISTKDLSGSIWLWYRENGLFSAKKVIEIPSQPADPKYLPPLLQGFKACPPLITDIVLSVDDRYLYISCWGTGELHQYDVSDPFSPKFCSSVKMGGIVNRTPHPKYPERSLSGGAQMVECSLDGKRLYFTSSLYAAWDKQFYPHGLDGWMAKVNVDGGRMELDSNFFVDFGKERPHQVRLEGGDASSDSYWFS